VTRARILSLLLALGLAACGPEGAPPDVRSVGVATDATARARVLGGAEGGQAARLYSPARGPVPLVEWASLPAPAAPVPAVIYLPACSTPAAPRDHIPYLQRQGVAVLVPALGGLGCVDPEMSFNNVRVEIQRLAEATAAVPWIDGERLYLMGHSIGADLATSFDEPGVFRGVIGLAAVCTFGVDPNTPTLTFRALDDPVLAIRRTRCTQFASPNALHLEFAGNDHVMRLRDEGGGGSQLMARAIAEFIGAGQGGAATTIADSDARDLQQVAAPTTAPPEAVAADEAVPQPAVTAVPAAAPVRDTPAYDAGSVSETPPSNAADAAPTSPPTADAGEVIFMPSLSLPPGTF
jgi:hypothetical protein